MKAIFVESSLPNVSKNFVLKNIGILSDKYMSLIRETLKYCLADLFRKWGGRVPLWRTKSAKQYLKASLTHFPILCVLAFSLSQMAHISSQANGFGPNPRWCIQRKVNPLEKYNNQSLGACSTLDGVQSQHISNWSRWLLGKNAGMNISALKEWNILSFFPNWRHWREGRFHRKANCDVDSKTLQDYLARATIVI